MLATDRQINYLQALADRVERARKAGTAITTPYINWRKERSKGVTTIDASIRIDAYRSLIRAINMRETLCNRPQI